MKLFELVGRDKTRGFSPFVWRTKLALAHKGLKPELVPLRFTEIQDVVAFAGSKKVPVLVDGEATIKDSWDIACYLEDNYSDKPSLFGGDEARTAPKLLSLQVAKHLLMPLFKTLFADIHDILDEEDQNYFRKTREPRIGCSLEEARKTHKSSLKIFQNNLWPYNQYLKDAQYLSGVRPAYNDYMLYSTFLWARCTSSIKLFNEDVPIASWIGRMDKLFDGLGGCAKKIE